MVIGLIPIGLQAMDFRRYAKVRIKKSDKNSLMLAIQELDVDQVENELLKIWLQVDLKKAQNLVNEMLIYSAKWKSNWQKKGPTPPKGLAQVIEDEEKLRQIVQTISQNRTICKTQNFVILGECPD